MLIDLGGSVGYNGFQLHDGSVTGDGSTSSIGGCKIERIVASPVAAIGYSEKRARADGNDASDVYLGPRQLMHT